MPRFLALEPGDTLTINANGFLKNVRIEGLSDNVVREVSARSFDVTVFTPIGGVNRSNAAITDQTLSAPVLLMMDLPLLDPALEGWKPYAAGFALPWAGGISVYKSVTTSNFILDSILTTPSTIGSVINNPVPGAICGVWDNQTGIEVKLLSGSLESVTDDQVLAGANVMALQNAAGGWEVFQFATATLLAPLTYRLTRLLRGQLGTEDQVGLSVPVDSRVVVLTGALTQLAFTIADINRTYNFKFGPVSKPLTDDSYRDVTQTFSGRGLKPYSVAQPAYLVDGVGNVTLSWFRRTRIGGDSWDVEPPPLNEEFERYEIDILKPGNILARTITVTSATSTVYTAAQQISDTVTRPFSAVIYQISATVGRGIARRIEVT